MPNEPSRDDLQQVWQQQEVEEMHIPAEEIRRKAMAFQRKIQRRNLREYAACAVVIVWFTFLFATTAKMIPRISFALIIAAAIYVAWHLLTAGAANPVPGELGQVNCLAFHRRELERQRNLLRSIWRWYLGPFIPGMALLIAGSILSAPPQQRWFSIAYAGCAAVFFWWVGKRNKCAAQRLDRQINELSAMQENER